MIGNLENITGDDITAREARVIQLVRNGVSITRTAKLIGIRPALIVRWAREDQDFGDELRAAIKAAETDRQLKAFVRKLKACV